jgi:putative ABC transport system permease protein
MLKSYFKIAWRNLFQNKSFSITNVLGLTIGITCTILILLWVQDEVGYDRFHKNYSTVYKVMATRNFKNQIFTDENMVLPLARSIETDVPQVKQAVVTTHRYPTVFTYGQTKLKKQGYTVSEHFFNIFSWKFVKGNPTTALSDPSSVVLSKSAAIAFFGNDNPINKVLRVDNSREAKVTAVVDDAPGNSSLQFDYVFPFNYSDDNIKASMNEWTNSSWTVFLQMVPGASVETLNKNINQLKYSHDPNDRKVSSYFTFPMSKWRLYSDFKDGKNVGGMIEYVRLFTEVALIILLIACINFMNLSTARSEKRAKEVGVRKTLGSNKRQLIAQFFFESMILTVIAFLLSVVAVYLLLPGFNKLVDKQLVLDVRQPVFWLLSVSIIVITGLVAGSYPALYLSSFNPIMVLKGSFLAGKAAVLPRRILVVLQFVISILLISSTIVVYQQIKHVRNRDIGYNPNNLIMIPNTSDTQKNFTVIKDELLKTGKVNSVTRTFSPITEIWWKSPSPDYDGKPVNTNIIFTGFSTDADFSKTLGIKILQGSDFSGSPSDSSSMLLNKAAVEAMGLKSPIGMQMRYGKNYTVIGVMENVIMESPFKPVEPMMAYYRPDNSNYIDIRLNQSVQPQDALGTIESIFKRYNPAYPFEYTFADQEFGKKFITEELIGHITNLFAGLAIFICCIGLAGLASFTIEKRMREIGIRKVLGASVHQLVLLVSTEFLRLVLIAFIIAVPLTWWLMNNWLQKYAYRVNVSIGLFGIVGFLMFLLTLIVVSLNTMKAATANPVKTLRTE